MKSGGSRIHFSWEELGLELAKDGNLGQWVRFRKLNPYHLPLRFRLETAPAEYRLWQLPGQWSITSDGVSHRWQAQGEDGSRVPPHEKPCLWATCQLPGLHYVSEPIALGKVVLCLQKLAPEWLRTAVIVLLSGDQMAALSGQLLLENVFKVFLSGITRLVIQQLCTLGYNL